MLYEVSAVCCMMYAAGRGVRHCVACLNFLTILLLPNRNSWQKNCTCGALQKTTVARTRPWRCVYTTISLLPRLQTWCNLYKLQTQPAHALRLRSFYSSRGCCQSSCCPMYGTQRHKRNRSKSNDRQILFPTKLLTRSGLAGFSG